MYFQITVDLFKVRCTELFFIVDMISDQFIVPIQVNSVDMSSFVADIDGCVFGTARLLQRCSQVFNLESESSLKSLTWSLSQV